MASLRELALGVGKWVEEGIAKTKQKTKKVLGGRTLGCLLAGFRERGNPLPG